MIDYRPLSEVTHAQGLRIVLVAGFPSPWSQAAKTIFELKGLAYKAAAEALGEENAELAAWSGQRSAPVVAWNDEKPIHNWMDILHLAERLSPTPALIPADPMQRALMFGLSREILGELGVVWNRRLQMLARPWRRAPRRPAWYAWRKATVATRAMLSLRCRDWSPLSTCLPRSRRRSTRAAPSTLSAVP